MAESMNALLDHMRGKIIQPRMRDERGRTLAEALAEHIARMKATEEG